MLFPFNNNTKFIVDFLYFNSIICLVVFTFYLITGYQHAIVFTEPNPLIRNTEIIFGVLAVLSAIIDNVLPIYATKKFNGSKKGIWGSAIGLVVGLFFFPPFGIIIGPMAGAFIGEIINGKSPNNSVKPAFGSFIGFLSSIFLRLALSIVMAYYFVVEVFIA